MHHTRFEALSDDELHVAVRRLAARSNMALADLLVHLGEVEARGVHRNRACATLYTYCQYELRMSEDAAYRRSKAARIVHQHPELRDIIARGEIHLTGLLMIAPLLGGERHGEVLARARFRSKREIARLMAELDPKPAVPALVEPLAPATTRLPRGAIAEAFVGLVRDLPDGDRPADWVDPPEGAPADASPEPAERARAETELAEAERALESAWDAAHNAQPGRPLRFRVQFTASQEHVDLLEEAIELLGYKKKAATLPEVHLRALRELVERLRKRKRSASTEPATTRDAPVSPALVTDAADSAKTQHDAPARVTDATVRSKTQSDAPARVTDTTDSAKTQHDAPARVTDTTDSAKTQHDAPARVTDTTDSSKPPSAAPARITDAVNGRGRHVPAAVNRAVWARDGAQCAYMDERGRRCAERRGLELHHREPHARGGPPTEDNLELRCRAHNTLAAEVDFGRKFMDFARGRESIAT